MRVFIPVLLAGVLLAGCSDPSTPDAQPTAGSSAQAQAAAVPAPPAAPEPVIGNARTVKESSDLYEFGYAYPATAAAIPGLKALLDKDLEVRKAALVSDARQGQAEAKKDDFPYHPYSLVVDWKVVTDLPGWLSMSTIVGVYTGGAHPNYGFESLLWNRSTSRRYAPEDLFVSKAALSAAIKPAFCAELDRQRAKKRQGQEIGGGIPEFSECIEPTEQTIILGSSHGKAFNRIGLLVSPYAAGPYAEGDYDVTVRVTDAVLKAVKPEYLPLFSTR